MSFWVFWGKEGSGIFEEEIMGKNSLGKEIIVGHIPNNVSKASLMFVLKLS